MIVIVALIGLGILLDLVFAVQMWPPWRSASQNVAWVLWGLAVFGALFESAVLLATFKVPVPAIAALVLLLGKDAFLIWRMVQARRR